MPEPAPVCLDSLIVFLYLGFLVPSSFSGVINSFYVSMSIILLLLMVHPKSLFNFMVMLSTKKIKLPLVTYFFHEFPTHWPSMSVFGASLMTIAYTSL